MVVYNIKVVVQFSWPRGEFHGISTLAQLFKTNDVVSQRFVKISNINITNTLLFFVEKM